MGEIITISTKRFSDLSLEELLIDRTWAVTLCDTDEAIGCMGYRCSKSRKYKSMKICLTLPSLYAGKMHALIFRAWKNPED